MRRLLGLVSALLLALPGAVAAAPRASALDLALAARPELASRLDRATRAVLAVITVEEARALGRGEAGLADLRLPDGTPVAHFLASVLGGGTYAIPFATLDAGGGESVGGGYHLVGTIGQPDAATLAGEGGWLLVGGFRGRRQTGFLLFRDGFESADAGRWSAALP